MEIYDTEEAQVEALKAWWKENKRSVIVGSILGAALVVGFNYWKSYQLERANQAATLYVQQLHAMDTGNQTAAEQAAHQLTTRYGNLAYADYATLIQAKLKVQTGDVAGAKQLLQGQLQKGHKVLRHVARIELVRLMLATKEYEQGLKLIAEVDPATTKSFSASYDELTGDLYVALNRLGEARTAYQNAMREGHGSPLLPMKLDDITTPETVPNSAG